MESKVASDHSLEYGMYLWSYSTFFSIWICCVKLVVTMQLLMDKAAFDEAMNGILERGSK